MPSCYAFRGEPLTGGPAPDPIALNMRVLAMQLLLQAVRDAKYAKEPFEREAALSWLNAPEGRGIASALNLRWGSRNQPITEQDLPVRVRGTYFRGD